MPSFEEETIQDVVKGLKKVVHFIEKKEYPEAAEALMYGLYWGKWNHLCKKHDTSFTDWNSLHILLVARCS